jgi:quinol monooxygenase YgiN
MSNMSLGVIARVAAKADRVEQVRAILMGVVEPTRREPGYLSYQLLRNQADPTDFTFIEEWASAAAELSHFATPHISGALRQLPGLLAAEPDVRRYTVLK